MATDKQEISDWFDRGVKLKATHLLVVCDTFDYEYYPVYAKGSLDCHRQFRDHNGRNMQQVREVYDLNADKQEQMDKSGTVMRLPAEITD